MTLAPPGHQRRRTSIEERPFSTLTCPHDGHQVSWCRQLCVPIAEHGVCGRLAPQAMMGRTQLAIAAYNAARDDSR